MEDEGALSLIEVFNILYQGSRDEGDLVPEKQCGNIQICSNTGVQYLYKVDLPDLSRPPITFGDNIVVTVKGPTYCTLYDMIYLKYDLFGGVYKGTKHLDLSIDRIDSPDEVFMREIRLQSDDGFGEIAVTMGQYADATVAGLEVTLLDNNSNSEVYGVIGATNSELDMPICTSLLFVKMPDYAIRLGDGVLPLSKSHVAVPVKSVLYVDISLTYNGVDHKGSLSFDAQKQGEFKKYVNDVIQVKVNWYDDDDKICSMYDKVAKI